jgi:hypothetical protein
MSGLDPERRRSVREGASSGLRMLFFIAGSILNLLALLLLLGNSINLTRLWLSGGPVTLGPELLAPFGAFLAGVICFLIANMFD